MSYLHVEEARVRRVITFFTLRFGVAGEDGLRRWKPKRECTLILVISSISVMLHVRASDSELEARGGGPF